MDIFTLEYLVSQPFVKTNVAIAFIVIPTKSETAQCKICTEKNKIISSNRNALQFRFKTKSYRVSRNRRRHIKSSKNLPL
jgi:hypothetical protein